MGKKLKTLRLVTFKEDFGMGKGKVTYKKGETHAMHENTAAKIEKAAGKGVEVKKWDKAEHLAKIKAANKAKEAGETGKK